MDPGRHSVYVYGFRVTTVQGEKQLATPYFRKMVKRSREEFASSSPEAGSLGLSGPLSSSNTSRRLSAEPSHTVKYLQLDQGSSPGAMTDVMQCHLPPHKDPLSFSSFEEYDVHYFKYHVNRCLECAKNFPSEHFMYLHIAENHDPLNEARRARGEKTVGSSMRSTLS